MGPKKQIQYKGQTVTGQSLSFEPSAEPWNQYRLEDGTIIKMKNVLMEVTRLDQFDDKGNPIYQFAAQQIVSVEVTDELKHKKDQSVPQ